MSLPGQLVMTRITDSDDLLDAKFGNGQLLVGALAAEDLATVTAMMLEIEETIHTTNEVTAMEFLCKAGDVDVKIVIVTFLSCINNIPYLFY